MELIQALDHLLADVGKLLDELRREVLVHSEQIVEDQNLAIHVGTGTDAENGNADRLCDRLRYNAGHAFQNDAETAGDLTIREGLEDEIPEAAEVGFDDMGMDE